MKAKNKRVAVAMSGGVDSSVAAAVLQEQGYDVLGLTMKLWSPSIVANGPEARMIKTSGCCSVEAAEDARKVAASLGIPHYVLDAQQPFETTVIANFCAEYAAGHTPNPCIECNRHLKFQWLLEKAGELNAPYLATGHYARILLNPESQQYGLHRGLDSSKDQSYALYVMTQQQLARTLLPLGDWTKEKVREYAKAHGFRIADKPDSQEICFVEDDNYPRFLEERHPELVRKGPIKRGDGQIVGEHRGTAFYTIGQRRGMGISAPTPLYVFRIDAETNTLWVGEDAELYSQDLKADCVNWISGQLPEAPFEAEAQIRYHSTPKPATITQADSKTLTLYFHQPQRAITPGQSVVIYQKDQVMGGGIIA